MLEPSTSISLRPVQLCKTMWRRCIQATCNFFKIFSSHWIPSSSNHICTGRKCPKQNKVQKKSVVIIMLPYCAVTFFKCANDYAATCQWWHACLGLPTPGLGALLPSSKDQTMAVNTSRSVQWGFCMSSTGCCSSPSTRHVTIAPWVPWYRQQLPTGVMHGSRFVVSYYNGKYSWV